jgi:hypothetical protein
VGKNVYIVGSTFLHELCHWGHDVKEAAEKREAGLNFENATYGKIIG